MDPIRRELLELGVISNDTVEDFYPDVRTDEKDVRAAIKVLRDSATGVIFLDRTDHMDIAHYEEIPGGTYWGAADRAGALEKYRVDDERRASQFAPLVHGKRVVDVGCGTGGFMDRIRDTARSVAGIEPQVFIRNELASLGYSMYSLPEHAPSKQFDVATLFHVLEHITTPLATLKATRELLIDGGTIIIEVPHASDALLALDSFKKFSLWSEHLVLHTKESLCTYLRAAGFTNIEVNGYQRYPFGNHLGWLADGKPGGQLRYPQLHNQKVQTVYENILHDVGKTDTLIATATR